MPGTTVTCDNFLCRRDIVSTDDHNGELRQGDLRQLMWQEIAMMRKDLSKISASQAELISAMDKMSASIRSLTNLEPSVTKKIVKQCNAEPDFDASSEPLGVVTASPEWAVFHDEGNKQGANEIMVRATSPDTPEQDHESEKGTSPERSAATRDLTIPSKITSKSALFKSWRGSDYQRITKVVSLSNKMMHTEFQKNRTFMQASLIKRLQMLSFRTKSLILESVADVVVVSNLVFMGISADNWNGEINGYAYVDLIFGILFLSEMVIKVFMHGFTKHFCGKDKIGDCFDALLVAVDSSQLFLVFYASQITEQQRSAGVPPAAMFRTVRILRVTRVLRLFRLPQFGCQDLLSMLEGIVGGKTTLSWSVVLFALFIYVIALLANAAIGFNNASDLSAYFHTVPISMFTVIRCSFGDCNTSTGQPISELLNKKYGITFSLPYSFFVFFVNIGLFNVISAIFVDRTMARAAEQHLHRLQERFADEKLWVASVCTVIRRCLIKLGHDESQLEESGYIDESMLSQEIPREVVDDLCQNDAETIAALNDLDIDPADHGTLGDTLDPDHSGTINFTELLTGLQRMRGLPRRSDIVSVDLMLRATQDKLELIHEAVDKANDNLRISVVETDTPKFSAVRTNDTPSMSATQTCDTQRISVRSGKSSSRERIRDVRTFKTMVL